MHTYSGRFVAGILAVAVALTAPSCSRNAQQQSATVVLIGAGATFPNPIYSKWFSEFHKARADVRINYQSIGSGGGIRQLLAETVDFGASDSPMTDQQIAEAKRPILHLPTVLGAVVPAYSLPGLSGELKFTPEALAGIFLGKIQSWDDAALKSANPGVALPSQPILVVHRSDGSGTTFVFTDYLSKVSPEWKQRVGASTAVNWPVGLGGKGNEGVAGLVRQTPGAIGYIELVYADQNRIPYGSVRNAAGAFVKASVESTTAAAAAASVPADFRVSITNAPGAGAYPIASFTWLLVPTSWRDAGKAKAMQDFLNWMIADGQKQAPQLGYAPLPGNVADSVRQNIGKISGT